MIVLTKRRVRTTALAACLVSSIGAAAAALEVAESKGGDAVSFSRHIAPVFKRNCVACHNATKAKAKLNLESAELTLKGSADGPVIVPGKADESLLFLVSAHIEEEFMPPAKNKANAKNLTPEELGLLKRWINEGAKGDDELAAEREVVFSAMPEEVAEVYAAAISPDNQFAAAGRGNKIHIYHLATGNLVAELKDPALAEKGGAAHLDVVGSLAFSKDGALASGGFRTVKIWRQGGVAAGDADALGAPPEVPEFVAKGHGGKVTAFTAFGEGGKFLLSGGADATIKVWDKDKPDAPLRQAAAGGPVVAVAASVDGKRLASATEAKVIKLWNGDDMKQVAELKTGSFQQRAKGDADRRIAVLNGYRDGRKKKAEDAKKKIAEEEGKVKKAEEESKKADEELAKQTPPFEKAKSEKEPADAEVAKREKEFADAEAAREGKAKAEAEAVEKAKVAASQLADKQKAAGSATEADKEKLATEVETAKKAKADADALVGTAKMEREAADKAKQAADAELKKAKDQAKKLTDAFVKVQGPYDEAKRKSEEGKRNIEIGKKFVERAKAASADADAQLAEAESRHAEATKALEAANDALGDAQVALRGLAFGAGDSLLVAAGEDGHLHTWSASDGSAGQRFEVSGGPLERLAALPSGEVAGVSGGKAQKFNVSPGWALERTIGDISNPKTLVDRVTAVGFSPDGQLLATGGGVPSRGGELKLWKVADGVEVAANVDDHSDSIVALAFSPDGRRVATAATDRNVKVFSAEGLEFEKVFEGHTNHVLDVAWRADGLFLASSGADKVVKVWDFEAGTLKQTVQNQHKKAVTGVAYVGTGDNLVSCGGGGQVRFANNPLPEVSGFVHTAEASADGALIAAGGEDGVLRIWRASDRKVAHKLE